MGDPEQPSSARIATTVNWIAIVVIIVALMISMRALPLEQAVGELGRRLDQLGGWAPVAFGAVYAIATVLFLPGWILTIAAGVFFGLLVGAAAVSIGSTLGAATAFLIARHIARERVKHTIDDSAKLRALDDAIGEGGWKVVALLRLSPAIPFNLQNYLYGVTQIGFWPCVIASWLAMLPGTFLYVYIGHVAGAVVTDRSSRSFAEWLALAAGLLATIVVTVYITRLARRQLNDRTDLENRERADDDEESRRATGPMWRTFVVSGLAVLAASGAVLIHIKQDSLESIATDWFGPPRVELTEAYEDHAGGPTVTHDAFTQLLRQHVTDGGWVDYASLGEDQHQLDAYLATLALAPYKQMSRDHKLALLLNAYNAFTLRLILDHWDAGGLESIRRIPADHRWTDQRWNIGGQVWSLDEIEHEEIRPNFREPRVHFALVCAAVGCPPLNQEAYDGARIDQQLEAQSRYVHEHQTWYHFDQRRDIVHLTALYDWFAGDFEQVAGSVLEYAARYSPSLRTALDEGATPQIEWLDYNWDLNSTGNATTR